ncbi:MAG: AI-2E family transporter [Lentisphaeria bacterium]
MNNTSKNTEIQRQPLFTVFFFSFLFLLVATAVLVLIWPFIHPIIIGSLITVVSFPLFSLVNSYVKRESIAATITVVLIALIVIGPFSWFVTTAINQGTEFVSNMLQTVEQPEFKESIAKRYDEFKQSKVYGFLEKHLAEKSATGEEIKTFDISNYYSEILEKLNQYLSQISGKVFGLIASLGTMLLNFFIMLIVMFYGYTKGTSVITYLRHISPLSDDEKDQIINRVKSVSKSAMLGTVLTACCQGLVALIGFSIAGLDSVFFLATLMGLSSIVPVIGTAIVLIPLLSYQLLIGNVSKVVFIVIWCLILNNVVDYGVRPLLMKGKDNMPTVLLLFAILGGVHTFGLLGFIYGPVIFAMMAVLLIIYEQRNARYLGK